MNKKRSNKHPKIKHKTSKKNEPRVKLYDYGNETVSWKLSFIDKGGDWGWKKIGHRRWEEEILPKLINFESKPWAEIVGKNNHLIPVSNIIKKAQDRLVKIERDRVEELFSLRLDGKTRLYGIRDRATFKIIWFDFNHEICTSHKKHT